MNTKSLFAVAAFAALAAVGAHAEGSGNERNERNDYQFQSTRTRAEGQAEAATAGVTREGGDARGDRGAVAQPTAVARDTVRAEAVQAVRLSLKSHSDAGTI